LIIAVGEHQRTVLLQVRGGEDVGIVRGIDGKSMGGGHFADGGYAGSDIVVNVALAVGRVIPGIDQDFSILGRCERGAQRNGGQKPAALHESDGIG